MLNTHEYTRLMDEAVEAAVKGKRFPDKIKGHCPHCGEELSLMGHHLPGSDWDDDLCRSIVSSYGDTLQSIYKNKDLFTEGPNLAVIDNLLKKEPWYRFFSTIFFIKRDPEHPLRIAQLRKYSAKMHKSLELLKDD